MRVKNLKEASAAALDRAGEHEWTMQHRKEQEEAAAKKTEPYTFKVDAECKEKDCHLIPGPDGKLIRVQDLASVQSKAEGQLATLKKMKSSPAVQDIIKHIEEFLSKAKGYFDKINIFKNYKVALDQAKKEYNQVSDIVKAYWQNPALATESLESDDVTPEQIYENVCDIMTRLEKELSEHGNGQTIKLKELLK